jgi:hypothetical protein
MMKASRSDEVEPRSLYPSRLCLHLFLIRFSFQHILLTFVIFFTTQVEPAGIIRTR